MSSQRIRELGKGAPRKDAGVPASCEPGRLCVFDKQNRGREMRRRGGWGGQPSS